MRSKFIRFLTLLVLFVFQLSYGQQKTVKGTVSDDLGPAAGANVVIKGTKVGTTTDFDGNFTISAKEGDVLEISFVGSKQSITVGKQNFYQVKLKAFEMKEVVITQGYDRTATKAASISAQTTISSEIIENRPSASVLGSLQGTAPGLTMISSSGSPGSAKFDGLIRGASSINGNTDPLIVIDGIPSTSNQFRNLNQNDVESITVLRDAAGTSIYGNKGANGVIQITTKRAKYNSGLKFTYDSVTGFNVIPENKYNMANAREALTIEKRFNVGRGATLTDAEIANWAVDTDWRDVFFNVDRIQQHNLGISLGGENFNSFTSLNYFEQGGLVPTTDFKRFALRNNLQAKSKNDKFTFDSQIALAHSKRNQLVQETTNGVNNNTIQNPLHGSVMGLPYIGESPYQTGQELFVAIGTDFANANDTWVLQDNLRSNHLPGIFTENSAIVNLGASYKLTDNLTFRNRAGLDLKDEDRISARAPWAYLSIAVRNSRNEAFGGSETLQNTKTFNFTNIASLSYQKTFKEKHNLNLSAYLEYTKVHYNSKLQFQNGLNPLTYSPGAGTGYIAFNPETPDSYISTASATKLTGGTLAYFATADYDYDEKYGFGGTIRRDATYRFINENRWGTFWSVSGRWNIDKEDFMKGTTFDLLKLRASYGVNGNQNIVGVGYGFPSLLTATNIVRNLNDTGNGYNNVPGILVSQLANPQAKWEEITQANVGLDFRMLNRKFEGNIDVYKKTTSNLFNRINTSAITGVYGINGNNGELENKGVELSLKYNIIQSKDLNFSIFANSSYNKTRVTALGVEEDQSALSNLIQEGNLLREWNLIPYAGVNPANGNMLFYDINGNLTETPDESVDRRATGKSPLPVYQGGFGFNFDYKGFYVNTLFSYAYDFWRIDNQFIWANTSSFIGDDNVSADLLNAWTPANPNSNIPALAASNRGVYDTSSDRFLYDSSFLRLKNVNFGYNFSPEMLKGTPIDSLKFYLQGENLLTWTKWRGFDPEAITSLSVTNYPNPISVTFGVNVGF